MQIIHAIGAGIVAFWFSVVLMVSLSEIFDDDDDLKDEDIEAIVKMSFALAIGVALICL